MIFIVVKNTLVKYLQDVQLTNSHTLTRTKWRVKMNNQDLFETRIDVEDLIEFNDTDVKFDYYTDTEESVKEVLQNAYEALVNDDYGNFSNAFYNVRYAFTKIHNDLLLYDGSNEMKERLQNALGSILSASHDTETQSY